LRPLTRIAATLACVALVAAASPATAQEAGGTKTFEPGASCRRQTDDFPGVVKMDACHRVYCGRTDMKDITEIDPDIAERLHCAWTLVAGKCKCVRQ